MPELITIARPYAKAAFEFADEHNCIDQWQNRLNVMAQVSRDKQIQGLLSSSMKAESVADIFIAVMGQNELDEYSKNFIKILAENNRLSLLPEILTLFNLYYAQKLSIADVDVISSKPLSDVQLSQIAAAMEKRLSQKVNVNNSLDESLLSGFIIRVGDMVIDSSIKGRLARLADTLQS